MIWTPNDEFTGDTVNVIAQTEKLEGLVDYIQKLGTNRGKWRDLFEPQRIDASMVSIPRSEEWIAFGKEVYTRRCEGCHGDNGTGTAQPQPSCTNLTKKLYSWCLQIPPHTFWIIASGW
ncbi:MAG: hypothetical protein Ct9H300mP28_13260 [Pseudomonadota bacterium]|nr:MAG: hypothetical protein Ct9H300mP28_13260 [Pseudomonadota bacterium]